jgi:hypothetical protein
MQLHRYNEKIVLLEIVYNADILQLMFTGKLLHYAFDYVAAATIRRVSVTQTLHQELISGAWHERSCVVYRTCLRLCLFVLPSNCRGHCSFSELLYWRSCMQGTKTQLQLR